MEDIKKRLTALENAISNLWNSDLAIMRIMADEACRAYYHTYFQSVKGEEIAKYREIWGKRLQDTQKEITEAKTIEDVCKIRDKFNKDILDYVTATKVDTADKAMEIAHSFIKKYSPVALPLKAVKEDNVWLVDIDVGPLAVKIAKVKVDARTGDILSYEIPPK